MRRILFILTLFVILFGLTSIGWADTFKKVEKYRVVDREKLKYFKIPYVVLALPDLTVTVEGPENVAAGDEIDLIITVKNEGNVDAWGSIDYDYRRSYYVDLILSKDAEFPLDFAVTPAYAGATAEDFIEDMLFQGGRISRTYTLPKDKEWVYEYGVHVPANIEPGYYYVAAVVDPGNKVRELSEANNTGAYLINIYEERPPEATAPAGVGIWVMPYAIGGTPINQIESTGLVDYRDSLSGIMMVDAPFGKRLGFRLGYERHIPMPQVYYYRWLYKRDGGTTWSEFTEPVGVHYVREVGGVVSFPVLMLGPVNIAGQNLYRFRPHNPPNELPAVTYWPTTDWFGDIYSGFLNSNTIPNGKYTIKLEIFDNAGVQVIPDGSANTFIVPNGTASDGTILTRAANPTTEIHNGGFIFPLHIDNSPCTSYIDAPSVGGSTASDECGFLIYGPDDLDVLIAFDAVHPNGFANFRFRIYRGIELPVNVSAGVFAISAPPFDGDGAGNFAHNYGITELLSTACPLKAAFSENLYVYAKATRGWHQRINHYDSHFVRAFALAPI